MGATENGLRKVRAREGHPYHVSHPTFEEPGAEALYGPQTAGREEPGATHLVDELTRDFARRMHYAAWRSARAATEDARQHWQTIYLDFRDRIVLGNLKLIYRAVRRWLPPSAWADDMVGDCQIVLLQAVAAYNPWLGIRFSTYAFTCLMRALSRLSQRYAGDRLARCLPLDSLTEGEPPDGASDEGPLIRLTRIDELLSDRSDLLSGREKRVLVRRFSLDEQARGGTLAQVGREMGLSKERVRQVQASALGKLRKALLAEAPAQ